MYLEIIREGSLHNIYTTLPVSCKEEASEIVKTIRKYHKNENISIMLKEKGKIIDLEIEQ